MSLVLPPSPLATLLFLLAPPLPAAPPAPDVQAEEKLLKEAGLPTDGPGLLKYFRARTPSEADRARLSALVRQLGHRSFALREKASRQLVASGEAALPFLRPALKDRDREIVRRAEDCVQEIERVPYSAHNVAAARVLAVRRPEGTVETLLGYLPFADWDTVGEQFLGVLASVGLKGEGKNRAPLAAVVEAATDSEVARRVAAAHVLGLAAPAHHKPLTRLVADNDPLVRYHASAALVRGRDKRGVPALVGLLEDVPFTLSWRAEDLLYRIAGERAPTPVTGAADDPLVRKKWRQAWEGWWKANQEKLDLAKVDFEDAVLGRTVTCEIDGTGQFPGRLTEFDRSGTQRWVMEGLESPGDFQRLPGGRVLVAEHWAQRVTERDRQGKVLWERKLADKPVSCERLPGGNTLIATYSEILDLAPDGKTILSHKHAGGMIYCACKLRGGNILFIDSTGRVVEMTLAGKEVRNFTPQQHASGAAYWASIEPLPGGRYLISLSGAGKVVETDATGKVLWECSVPTACYATRLRNGNTLVANVDGRSVVEVDRQGKEVWTKTTKGRPFRARRY